MKYDQKEQEAVFRYGLISEFIHGDLERGTKRKRLQKIAAGTYRVPWKTMPYEVSVSKLRRWIAAYRRHGIDGLKRKDRKDKGTTKAIDPVMAHRIVAIKKAAPSLSIPELIRTLEENGDVAKDQLKKSTVHRLLQRQNLSGRVGRDPGRKPQRLPFVYPNPMDMWMGDVMHGRFAVQGKKVYLIVFIDHASRAVMHAEYAFDESTLSILKVFRQAVLTRGLCKRVYVDHGSAFVDARFVRTCAHLGTHLLHAPVGDGAAKGPVERFIGTYRRQCESYLQPADLSSLDTLNSLLWRWIHTTYHQRPHHGIDGDTPWQRFMEGLKNIEHRRIAPDFDFASLWRTRKERTVKRDMTVSLEGHWLEVPPTVKHKKVELRYFPEKLPENVEVWDEDKHVGQAQPVDKVANIGRRRWRPKKPVEQQKRLPVDPLASARKTWKQPFSENKNPTHKE